MDMTNPGGLVTEFYAGTYDRAEQPKMPKGAASKTRKVDGVSHTAPSPVRQAIRTLSSVRIKHANGKKANTSMTKRRDQEAADRTAQKAREEPGSKISSKKRKEES